MKKERVLGVDVAVTSYEELKNCLDADIVANRKVFLVAINPEKIIKANKDPDLLAKLNAATYPVADGVGVIYASKLQGGEIRERITGIDCMMMILELASEKGYRVFLYGALPGVAELAKEDIEKRYPSIQIVGTMDGYEQNQEKIIECINRSGAQVLFVALGSPLQENFITQNMDRLCPNVFEGVGGSFDVFAGRVKRAPVWMQKRGLEWLYRLIQQPGRIFRELKLIKFLVLARKGRTKR